MEHSSVMSTPQPTTTSTTTLGLPDSTVDGTFVVLCGCNINEHTFVWQQEQQRQFFIEGSVADWIPSLHEGNVADDGDDVLQLAVLLFGGLCGGGGGILSRFCRMVIPVKDYIFIQIYCGVYLLHFLLYLYTIVQ
jgi:hypothetical protein